MMQTRKPITSQRIYAALRSAGYPSAKFRKFSPRRGVGGDWSPGVRVRKDSDTYTRWFDVEWYIPGFVTYKRDMCQRKLVEIVAALQAVGIVGELSADGLTYRVEE